MQFDKKEAIVVKKFIKKLWTIFINFCKMLLTQLKDPLNFIIFAIYWLIFFAPWWFGYILFFSTGNGWHLSYSSAWLAFWSLPFTPALAFIIAFTLITRKILRILIGKHRIKKANEEPSERIEKVVTRVKRKNKLF